jgi:predicted nucleic acid-binding protein
MIIMDCCAAVAMALNAEEGRIFQSLMRINEPVLSSQLFYAELDYAMGKYYRAGRFTAVQAQKYAEKAVELIDGFVDLSENYAEALSEGLHLGHSTYDMFYFTLARRNAATLFTLDKKLIKLCEEQGVDCVHIEGEPA